MENILDLLLKSGLIFLGFFIVLWGVNKLLIYFKKLISS